MDLDDRRAVFLEDTPFFPQEDYQCGPAALAAALVASGAEATPLELVPKVYLPARRGSLQTELVAAARTYARVPYVIDPDLDHLLDEIDAGRPVVVLQNLGFKWKPIWHYAVVYGYDPEEAKVFLRSGTKRHKTMTVRAFLRSWQSAGAWGIVLLRPGEVPANPARQQLLESMVALEPVQPPAVMAAFYRGFLDHFPMDNIARIGLANAYLKRTELSRAIALYRSILAADTDNVAASNNLAVALGLANCGAAAALQARRSVELSREAEAFSMETERTLYQLETRTGTSHAPRPALCD